MRENNSVEWSNKCFREPVATLGSLVSSLLFYFLRPVLENNCKTINHREARMGVYPSSSVPLATADAVRSVEDQHTQPFCLFGE